MAILEDIAIDAAARFNFPAGKPRNEALQTWVRQMRILLADLGQRFTYSDGPDGPSQALHFCEFVMALLDSAVTPKQLRGAIRQVSGSDRQAQAQTQP